MRTKTYFRRITGMAADAPGGIEELTFNPEHYREAGALITTEFGMNRMTAIELVNKWNRQNRGNFYTYWVE